MQNLIAAFWITAKWISAKIHRVTQPVIAKLSTCVLSQMGDCKTPCERFKHVSLLDNTTCQRKGRIGECKMLHSGGISRAP